MESYYAEIVGVAAAAASLYAAHAKTISVERQQQRIEREGRIGAVQQAVVHRQEIGDHRCDAQRNWRLHQMIDLVRGIDAAIASDMNVDWLVKHMRPETLSGGRRDDGRIMNARAA
jgi:hypothetical protein